MDLQELANKLSQYARNVSENVIQVAAVPAANELLAETKNRIIQEGKNSEGGDIGNYSTKEGYYSKEQFVNKGSFKGVGKNGGTPRKSMYLKQGYYQFKGIQGRENSKVNVTLSGDTMNRYQIGVEEKAVLFGMTTKKASDIRKGNEERFNGNIYASTTEELNDYNKNVANTVTEIYREIFK